MKSSSTIAKVYNSTLTNLIVLMATCLLFPGILHAQLSIENSTVIGGSGNDQFYRMECYNGKIYTIGESQSTDFPVTNGSTNQGARDLIMTCYDPATNSFEWSTYIGGDANDYFWDNGGFHIENGKIYVTAVSSSASFPAETNTNPDPGTNTYVNYCVDAATGSVDWSTWLGNAQFCCWYSSVVDNGKLYTVHTTGDNNWPETEGTSYDPATEGQQLAVVCTDLATGSVDWCRYIGGTGNDSIRLGNDGIQVINGQLIFSATTTSTDFPVTDGSTISMGNDDVIVSMDVNNGGAVNWATYVPSGNSLEFATDGNNLVVVSIAEDPGTFPVTTITGETGPVFIRSYDPASGSLNYSVLTPQANVNDVLLDGSDLYIVSDNDLALYSAADGSNIWLNSGISTSTRTTLELVNGLIVTMGTTTDLTTTNGTTNSGSTDFGVAVTDPQTGEVCEATQVGGTGGESIPTFSSEFNTCTIDGVVYFAGHSSSSDYPFTDPSVSHAGINDIVITGLALCPTGYVNDPVVGNNLQEVCENGLAEIIDANAVEIPGSDLPLIYRNGVAEEQPSVKAEYQWQVSTDGTTWEDIPGAILEDYLPIVGTETLYYRRKATNNSCLCETTEEFFTETIEVRVGADVAPEADAGGIFYTCAGSSVQIGGNPTATPAGGNYTYLWDDPAASTDANPTVSPAVSTIYTVVVTDEDTGCKSSDQAVVNVVGIDAGPDLCTENGAPVIIGGAPLAGSPDVLYNWAVVSGTATIDDATKANPTVSGIPENTSTTFELTLTVNAGLPTECTTAAQMTVSNLTGPGGVTDFAGPDQVVCFGEDAFLGTDAQEFTDITNDITTVSQSSNFDSTTIGTLTNLTDGDTSTGARTVNLLSAAPHWVMVDFGEVKNNITRVDVESLGGPIRLNNRILQYSVDGVNWTDITTIAGADGALPLVEINFPAVDAQYLRFYRPGGGGVGISELRVYTGWNFIWTPGAYISEGASASEVIYNSGTLTYPPTINPITYTLTANKNGCSFTDEVTVSVIHAIAGEDGCGPRQIGINDDGNTSETGVDATYSWTIIPNEDGSATGNSTILSGADEAVATVSASDDGNATTYEITSTYNGVSCKDTVLIFACGGGGCSLDIDPVDIGCAINGAQLIATPSLGEPEDYTYSWTVISGTTDPDGLDVNDERVVTLNDSEQRTYQVTATSTLDPTVVCTETFEANAPEFLIPAFDAEDVTTCLGETVGIGDDDFQSSGYTFEWMPADGLDLTNPANPTITATENAEYTVRVIDNVTGCSVEDMVTVTIQNVTANAGQDWTVCGPAVVGIGIDVTPEPNYTYSWTPVVTVTGGSQSGPYFEYQFQGTDPQPQTFSLTVTDLTTGCVSTDQATVTLDSNPSLAPLDPVQFCIGDAPLQIGPEPLQGVTYSWTPTTGLSAYDVAQPFVVDPAAGLQQYTVTASFPPAGCATDSETIDITVINPEFFMDDITVCPSDTAIQLGEGAPTTGVTSWSWTPAALLDNASIVDPTLLENPTTPTVFSLTVEYDNGCSYTEDLTVNPSIDAPNAGSNNTICLNETYQLGDAGDPAPTIYTWAGSDAASLTTYLSATDIANPVFTPEVTGTFTYEVTKTVDPGGVNECISTDQVTITVQDYTLPAISSPTLCQGGSTFIGVDSEAGVDYYWSPTTGLDSPTSSRTLASPTQTTSYTLTAVGPNGCTATANVLVSVNDTPAPTITMNDVSGCVGGGVVQFNPVISSGATPYTYVWAPDDGSISDINAANPDITIGNIGSKEYTLTVYDANGCSSVATANVVVSLCNVPLPVEFLYFKAEKDGDDALLTWATATETNSSHFIVERSNNGAVWENIGNVDAAGESLETILYSFTDQDPVVGFNYYRLKQVDLDGSYDYSTIDLVIFGAEDVEDVLLYPNPARSTTYLQWPNDYSFNDLQIIDMQGRVVDVESLHTGQKEYILNLTNMSSGMYVIRLVGEKGKIVNKKLIVTR